MDHKEADNNKIINKSGEGEIEVIDITGREIYSKTGISNKGENRINVEGLEIRISSGVYFYVFKSDYGTERGKIAFIR